MHTYFKEPAVQNDPIHDVIILGAGPAGATCATLLARKRRRVVVLEKEKFPRYHIGESLMPLCYFPLDRLGLIPTLKASAFPKKFSVQFVREDGMLSAPFYFFQHLKHEAAQTWQVWREDFDQIMVDNARAAGAVELEETTAKELIKDERGVVVGVRAVNKDGQSQEYRAPITVDATGRDAFAMTRNDWKVRDPQLNKVAIWTYYKGAKRDAGLDEGATTVAYVPEKGWFWYIPLPDDIVSVGIVAERAYLQRNTKDPQAIFQGEIPNNAWIKDHLSQGQAIAPYRVTNEFSYRSRHCAADGLVLIGDAMGFLDPVFSSGVFLALRSGELAADMIDEALAAGNVGAGRFQHYADQMRTGIESMRKLVYAFYDDDFSFGKMIRQFPHLRGDLTDCLIGDLFRDFTELFKGVAEFADIPAPLSHGGPLVGEEQALSHER